MGMICLQVSKILNRWKNYFSHLLNVHNVSDIMQIEVCTAEPLVPRPSRLEVETAIRKKRYKLPSTHQILAELIQAGAETLMSAIHILMNSILNMEEPLDQLNESIIVLIHIKGGKTNCSNYHVISLLSTSYNILSNALLSGLSPYIDEIIGHHQCGF
jgi:hypothetical protein